MAVATLVKRVQVLLGEDEYARLKKMAHDQGNSISAILREAFHKVYDPSKRDRAKAVRALKALFRKPILDDMEDWEREEAKVEGAYAEEIPYFK